MGEACLGFPCIYFFTTLYEFIILQNKKLEKWLGVVAHTYNPSTLGGRGEVGASPEVRRPGQHGKTSSLLKIQKLAGSGGMCL